MGWEPRGWDGGMGTWWVGWWDGDLVSGMGAWWVGWWDGDLVGGMGTWWVGRGPGGGWICLQERLNNCVSIAGGGGGGGVCNGRRGV